MTEPKCPTEIYLGEKKSCLTGGHASLQLALLLE
jgi:hypothetical protein